MTNSPFKNLDFQLYKKSVVDSQREVKPVSSAKLNQISSKSRMPPPSPLSLNMPQAHAASGAKQLSKLKRFLTTLQQFASDISPEIGDRVRSLVLNLVVCIYLNLIFLKKLKPA